MLVAYCILPLISALFLTYFPPLLLVFLYFSFVKTRLVWYCLNLIVSAFQLELIPCFPLKFMSLSLNILRIYFWLCSLESPSVSCLPCSFHTTPHDLFLPFSWLIPPLLLLFPFFSFLKTRLVWVCLNLVITAFQFELVPSFSLNYTSLSLNLLRIYFCFCCLETPSGSCLPCSWPTAY